MASPVPEAPSASASASAAANVTPIALADVQRHIAALSAERARRGQPLSGRVVHVAHYLPLTAALLPNPNAAKHPAAPASAVPSPPLTPPVRAADVDAPPFSDNSTSQSHPEPETDVPKWSLAPRAGHSAMVSGILGLAAGTGATEQVVVGWVGDLYRQLPAGVGPGSASGEPGTPALSALDIHAASPTTSTDALNTPMDPEAGGDNPPDARGFAKLSAKQVGDAERKALEDTIAAYTPPEDSTSANGEEERKKVSFVPVWLEDDVAHGHYDGYCKTSVYNILLYIYLYHICLSTTGSTLAAVPLLVMAGRRFRATVARKSLGLLSSRQCRIRRSCRRHPPPWRSRLGPRLPPPSRPLSCP